MKLTKKLRLLIQIALAGCVPFLILFVSGKKFFKDIELNAFDAFLHLKGPSQFSPHIIIVEITDDDISKVGVWSWSRSWHAAMAKALKDLGAKCVYFDILFSEPSDEDGDKSFAEAIAQAKNVYLPFAFQGQPYNIERSILPLANLSSGLKGKGSINILSDSDGVVRRVPLLFAAEDDLYPHISLKLAMDYLGLSIKELSGRSLILAGADKEIAIPLGDNNSMLINWHGKWQDTFRHYGFLQVLSAYKDILDKKPAAIDTKPFRDSICIVTVTATGICDIKAVPIQNEYPGAGIISTAISNIIGRSFFSVADEWINMLLLFLLAVIPAFLNFREKPLAKTGIVFLAGALFLAAAFLLFKNNTIVNLAAPLSALLISYLGFATYNFMRVAIEKKVFYQKATTDGLTGLNNIGYFKIMLDTEISLSKANPERKMAIVMSDVDHFKHFNDTYGHQVGDLVLKEVAMAIKGSVRAVDLVARYGGEEMIVLLRGAGLNEGLIVAEKIRKNIESRILKDEKNTYKVTASLGVSTFSAKDNTETLIKRADQGLYQAKESGRNRVCSVETPS